MSEINLRVLALREVMRQHGITAYLIPSSDAHQSEYVAPYWKSREWISGFSGSAGIAVITQDHAGVWTDSRYFIQAERELKDSEFELHKQGVPHAPEHNAWLLDTLPEGSIVGLDGTLFSLAQVNRIKRILSEKNIKIEARYDLIDLIWKDRPALPLHPIFEHKVKFAGKNRKKKIALIRTEMHTQKVAYHLVTTLDDIAWTFNIRGTDIEYNPLALAYAVIGLDKTWLFIDAKKVTVTINRKFEKEEIEVRPYASITKFLQQLPKDKKILINPSTANYYLANLLTSSQVQKGKTLSTALKAIKNIKEIAHLRHSMARDGAAILRMYRWLLEELDQRPVSEYELAQYLSNCREQQGLYHGESFPAIVGYQGNGAIVHYRPMPDTAALIKKQGILLLDSGGQYEDGTTDVTRTFALSEPSTTQKRHYTLVLKGHIAIANLIFPKGTKGIQIDALARQALWQNRLNYGHGTGHGVGFFLNVHEGPQSLSISMARGGVPFEVGMITSNEPGFYKEGEYGIRIENLLLCVEDESNEFGDFLKFEDLTLFPIDKQLIDQSLLNEQEVNWLNNYHQKVFDNLSPLLEGEEIEWLEEQCAAI